MKIAGSFLQGGPAVLDTPKPEYKKLRIQDLNPPLHITLVESKREIIRLGEFLESVASSKTPEIGLDTETNIEKFYWNRRVRTIQLGNRDEQFVVDLLTLAGSEQRLVACQSHYGAFLDDPGEPIAQLVQVLRPYLESNRILKVGHNLGFDYETLKWCLGLRTWHLYDTQLAEQVIHSGAVRFNISGFWALDDLVLRYLKVEIDKTHQKTFTLNLPLTQEQIEYAALDTRLPLALKACQAIPISKAGVGRAVKIENDAIPAFCDIHLNGLKIDVEKWLGLISDVEKKHEQNIEVLDKCFIPVVGEAAAPTYDLVELERIWKDELDKEVRKIRRKEFEAARREVKEAERFAIQCVGKAALNYGSPSQVLKALQKIPGLKKIKDTNDRTLDKLAGNPTIDALREFRETEKILKTYGTEFLEKYIHLETGRVHSRFKQLGAETGRTSSTEPNVQNILRGADWRGCFISRAGYSIITIDYNGCELRILAELSQEPLWIEAFKNGWDVHSVGAELLFGKEWTDATGENCAYVTKHDKCKCKGHKELRNRIKAINFGIAYGMEAKKLAEGLKIAVEEADKLLKDWRQRFHVINEYLRKSGMNARAYCESRTMSGRRRLFTKPTWDMARAKIVADMKKAQFEPGQKEIGKKFYSMWGSIEREGKNTPIQGTNADIIKLAMGCGFDPDGKPYAWHLIEPVYQSLLVNMVHDELLVESPNENAQQCYEAVADCMTRSGAEFVKSIPMTTDGHIDTKWVKD